MGQGSASLLSLESGESGGRTHETRLWLDGGRHNTARALT